MTLRIDRKVRDKMADAIESFIDAKIDNLEFGEIICECHRDTFEDRCKEMNEELDSFYGDGSRYRNVGRERFEPQLESILRRWVTLLRSNVEWPCDPKKQKESWLWSFLHRLFFGEKIRMVREDGTANEWWPFESKEEWERLFPNMLSADHTKPS